MNNGARGGDPGPLIRPYALTGGRTESRLPDLALEDLVRTTQTGWLQLPGLGYQDRAIVELCNETLSVAEISARLNLPLGVARILVSDLAASGLVLVHRNTAMSDDGRPSVELLERVLERLQAI